ncbi:hypothetical protein D9758_008750 [Tetrapyrgos nigripes]|uniref:Phosphatidylserine decarboxylase n=1 Tax=Tetrapyrgos nigripes TaxID=182062 RepID=A0A8H5D3R1_9AGAR|nr:hypothetical protein D9758_008750 [Tetrapyrgos nigripes]
MAPTIPGLSLPKPLKFLQGRHKSSSSSSRVTTSTLTTSKWSPQHLTAANLAAIHGGEDKPVEKHPKDIPDTSPEDLVKALSYLVEHSADEDVSHGIESYTINLLEIPGLRKLIPGLERLAAKYHIGNFVVVRETGERIFETMPIYARIGMHLLFYGDLEIKLLENKTVKEILKEQSVKQGKIYDSPESVKSILSFIKTYNIDIEELEEPDISKYGCFNDFFYRKLKSDARPVQNLEDPLSACCLADCRLAVYPTVDMAKEFWIKSRLFTLPHLLDVPLSPRSSSLNMRFNGGSLAIFRLAPADYHRFHCPVDAIIEGITWIGYPENEKGGEEKNETQWTAGGPLAQGTYYTVNPQAINQDLPVLESNVRSILYLRFPETIPSDSTQDPKPHPHAGRSIAIVAIGALLVGSIVWTEGGQEKGTLVRRGEELGYFKYGGSTVVVVWERDCMKFDDDLVKNSIEAEPIETLVRVGESLGRLGDR